MHHTGSSLGLGRKAEELHFKAGVRVAEETAGRLVIFCFICSLVYVVFPTQVLKTLEPVDFAGEAYFMISTDEPSGSTYCCSPRDAQLCN